MKTDYLTGIFGLVGKTVVLTGAAGQLGQELTRSLAGAGCEVIATDLAFEGKDLFRAATIEYRELDITKPADVVATFGGIYASCRRVDILVNNAGVSTFAPFEERLAEDFDLVMDVNLKGTFHCIRSFAIEAGKAGHGAAVVNIGSIYGVVSPDPRIYTDCARKNSEVYGATKAGIIQMTRYFAVHLASRSIRVNCVSPGGIFNPAAPQGEDFLRNYSFRCPMGRMAKAEEIAGAVLYLSSEAASYTTGQNIVVDGGFSCW